AILPFSVRGADAKLAYLRMGMSDLLTRELSVDSSGKPVAVGPSALGLELDESVAPSAASLREILRRTRAGSVVVGSVVGEPAHLVIQASLLDAQSGRALGTVSIEGGADSLATLSQRLVGELLALSEGVPRIEAGYVAASPLPALREFLAGERSAKRGR